MRKKADIVTNQMEPAGRTRPKKPTPKPRALTLAERKQRQSDLLDEALKGTFPASDPVSIGQFD